MMRSELVAAVHRLSVGTLVALAGCDNPSTNRPAEQQPPLVVLSITEFTGGPIKGSVACQDKDGRVLMDEACLPDATTLARSVLLCGPTQVTVDVGTLHETYAYFPSHLRETPTDLDVVKCVQRRVGFPFRAGISSVPPSHPRFNPASEMFSSLHALDAPQVARP